MPSLKTQVKELIPGIRHTNGQIGVEIEAELTRALPPNYYNWPAKHWSMHEEASLRKNGTEWVTNGALTEEELNEALLDFSKMLVDNKIRFTDSKRASVHVHLNVQTHRFIDLYNTVCCYWLVEPLLLEYSGQHRKGNLFCLGLNDADAIHSKLCEGLKNFTYFNAFNQKDDYRYAGLNLESIFKFGSIEIRTMRCTSDMKLIRSWAIALNSLKENAKTFRSPTHISDFVSNNDPLIFLEKLFPPLFVRHLIRECKTKNWMDLVHQNIWYVMDVANSHEHWDLEKDEQEAKIRDDLEQKKQNAYPQEIHARIPEIDDEHEELLPFNPGILYQEFEEPIIGDM
jgi:hypothetical protein